MKLQRLRLAGFKSFVDPTELGIEPGLTGVVGPNGCGKSNLLEALRWAMGAGSAKAMRATGMDEVIFAGGGRRPARDWAEVTLTLDNADGAAPAAFAADPVLQVSRRIDRGQGSTYRVNGREVRARDVQLLFADASTGANSPALVRQGQISELIAAKPENRRRVLEEAGGVSGLHGRRHEAELRLRAAEANLLRLDDVVRELEIALARLRREAKAAERYRRLSEEIRSLQAAVLHARWAEAANAHAAAEAEQARATAEVETTTRAAATATVAAADAEAALPPLRQEQMTAGAVLQRLTLERDRLQAQEAQARAEAERLKAELVRLQVDREREERIAADATGQLERLDRLVVQGEADVAAAPQRLPALQAAADAAEQARAAADAEVERLASALAAEEARRAAEAQRRADLAARVARARRALDQALADRAAAAAPLPAADAAAARLAQAEGALTSARTALDAADAARTTATAAETQARDDARKLDDRLGRLLSEARGLAQSMAPAARGGFPPALDAVQVDAGYEAALAAALGDDLQAALDAKAASYWGGAEATHPTWPAGVVPLAAHVQAPAPLAARLAMVGVCSRADGPALQAALPPGARLVSAQGDLWRWDGFVARADAPKPAAVRLAQRARLADLEAEIERLKPTAAAAAAAHKRAAAGAQSAADALAAARRAPAPLERALADARTSVETHARDAARRDARLHSLADTITAFTAELAEAEAAAQTASSSPSQRDGEVSAKRTEGSRDSAEDAASTYPQDSRDPTFRSASPRDPSGASRHLPICDGEVSLPAARARAAQAREAAAAARAALDAETRDAQGRIRRLETLRRERDDWSRRRTDAARRVETLDRDHARTLSAADAARDAPERAAAERGRLDDEHAAAGRRSAAAADALAFAETTRTAADRSLREADAAASTARETRATADARLQAAADRFHESAARIRDTVQLQPADLSRRLADAALALPPEVGGMEAHLQALERQREQMGGVNLLAETEAADQAERLNTLLADRADLTGAIARLREGVAQLNAEGRERLIAAFEVIQGHFTSLFQALFDGGQAELRLVESDDPLEAGLEIYACPPGKRLSTMSLMSGGEQALTATALIFAVFLANPAPICVLDEVDAPLDDANVDRFCRLLEEMTRRTATPFLVITHNGVTMSRMDRLYGVTMPERGVSQLVSVDLRRAELMAAE